MLIEHLVVYVWEASSFEAIQKLGMEPEIVRMCDYETSEIKAAVSFEEAMKMLKQGKC